MNIRLKPCAVALLQHTLRLFINRMCTILTITFRNYDFQIIKIFWFVIFFLLIHRRYN